MSYCLLLWLDVCGDVVVVFAAAAAVVAAAAVADCRGGC